MIPQRFTRYIQLEVLKLFLIALVAITTLIVVGWVAEQAVREGLGYLAIVKLIPYVLPLSMQFTLPTTLLFSVASVFGRMASENEVVAVKSLGISPLKIMKPTFLLALIISPIGVWLNDLAASWGAPGVSLVVMHSIEEIVYKQLKKDHYYEAQGRFAIDVKDVQDEWLISPVFTLYGANGGNRQEISAERARLSLNVEKESLLIELVDYQYEKGQLELRNPKSTPYELPLDQATRKGRGKNAPATLPLQRMSIEIREERERIRSAENAILARWSSAVGLGRPDLFQDALTMELRGSKAGSEQRLIRLQIEPWRRWALGFSCFFFVWMGLPLAIHMRNADYWMTFGVCFLPILVVYFPLFGLGLMQAKSGQWPAYSVWLGNLVLFIAGGYLIRVVYRA